MLNSLEQVGTKPMPHLIVEYSANLENKTDIASLLQQLHAVALSTGVFPKGGIRTRAARRDLYVITDGHIDNSFCHVQLRIGHGRSVETRKAASEKIFGAMCDFLKPVFDSTPLGLSLEVVEIVPETSFKQNNLHDYLAVREEDGK